MRDRIELVALGPELLNEARRQGKSINESYLMVHRVLAKAFTEDLDGLPKDRLRARLRESIREAAA